MKYRSNHLFATYPKDNTYRKDKEDEAKAPAKFDYDNTPLYRYFVPVLNTDKSMMNKKPFDVEMAHDKYTYTFHDLGGTLFALLDSGYKAVMEKGSDQMKA